MLVINTLETIKKGVALLLDNFYIAAWKEQESNR
jgi:hypothetical protein